MERRNKNDWRRERVQNWSSSKRMPTISTQFDLLKHDKGPVCGCACLCVNDMNMREELQNTVRPPVTANVAALLSACLPAYLPLCLSACLSV